MAKEADANSREHPKAARTPQELVNLLKARGVRFRECSEKDATDYLRHANNYLRAASYRKLYPIREHGPMQGNTATLTSPPSSPSPRLTANSARRSAR